ncbi:MAG: helix-hairpin-helix domain-containing protein [Sulfuricellaceae bacterium]
MMIKKLLVALFAFFAFSGFAMAAVDINSATAEQLDVLKGIGPAKAKAIIEYRTKNGPFKSVDDLENVKGIGKKTIDGFRADVTLGGGTSSPAPAKAKADAKAEKGKPAADDAKKK